MDHALKIIFRDLEKALKRLAQRRSVENKIIEERRRRTSLYRNKLYSETNSSLESAAGSKNNEKLRIIKTMEGSPLMQQWRYMAQVDLDTAVSQVTASGAQEPNTPKISTDTPSYNQRNIKAKIEINIMVPQVFEVQGRSKSISKSP